MRRALKHTLAGGLIAIGSVGHASERAISLELTGTVGTASADLPVFAGVSPGDEVTIRVVFDRSLPDASTVSVRTGDIDAFADGIFPIINPDSVQFFGILPGIEGLDADGGVTVSLALPDTSQLVPDAFELADLSASFGRASYASLVSVEPLVIDESAFDVRIDSVEASFIEGPNARCAPADFDANGTIDAADREALRLAFAEAIENDGPTDGLDFNNDGAVNNDDVAQAVFLLNRCSNEGPSGEPLVDLLDLNSDTLINILDLVLFVQYINTDDPRGDVDGSGAVDVFDVFTFLNAFDDALLL
ncbi:MAG: hypothetical protein AAGH64_11300 [Planctomycetota bacterium]